MKNRRNIYLAVAIILGALALSRFSVAQGQAPGLLVHAIKGAVYWTEGGGGGNTGIVIGQNGVIVIDAKTTPGSAKEMLGEIAYFRTGDGVLDFDVGEGHRISDVVHTDDQRRFVGKSCDGDGQENAAAAQNQKARLTLNRLTWSGGACARPRGGYPARGL